MADEIALTILGARFRYWNSVTVTRAIDSVAVAEFDAPFEPDAPGFKQLFKPLSYSPVTVDVDGSPFFAGTMLDVAPVVTDARSIRVSCYSTPGVLGDCSPPASAFPFEFNRMNLYEIAASLAAPFGVTVIFDNAPGARFDRVACEPDQKVLEFLTELAKQRGLLVSSNELGFLTFATPAAAGVPVARIVQGESPFLSLTPTIKPQEYYSHLTGLQPVIMGIPGAKYTVKNPRLSGVVRPYTFEAGDVLSTELKPTVEAKYGRMFANVVSYRLRVSTWRDPFGALWSPNTRIIVNAPGAMVYGDYTFLIRSVEFKAAADSRDAELELVLPESFTGGAVLRFPWD